MKVAILGSGMAGLLAAKAVFDVTGEPADIITNRLPVQIDWSGTNGIHVLHDTCGMNIPEMLVTNLVVLPLFENGEPQLLASLGEWERSMANGTYGQKVYGSRRASTSITRMPGVIEGYEYVTAFNILVNTFGGYAKAYRNITETSMHRISREYDFVVSSIPRHNVTPKWIAHKFSIAYVSQRPPIGFAPNPTMGKNFVVYNADPTADWSRTSCVTHGNIEYWSTEYASIPDYPLPDLRKVEKVLKGDNFVFPDNVLPVGRYGKWEAGVLASDAYWETVREVSRRAK
jgi:hypothetical protein